MLKAFKRKYSRLAENLYYDYPPDQIYDYSDKMYERGNLIYKMENIVFIFIMMILKLNR